MSAKLMATSRGKIVKTDVEPRTDALRRALASCPDAVAADLRFLEAWEAEPLPGAGIALRVGQIRRANPDLAAAIRAELAAAGRSLNRRS